MKLNAVDHYEVLQPDERHWQDPIIGLRCRFCGLTVYRQQVGQPRTSKSGLGRYNRMRGIIVKHIHEAHRAEVMAMMEGPAQPGSSITEGEQR